MKRRKTVLEKGGTEVTAMTGLAIAISTRHHCQNRHQQKANCRWAFNAVPSSLPVLGGIGPMNFPADAIEWRQFALLAAGNTLIFKLR